MLIVAVLATAPPCIGNVFAMYHIAVGQTSIEATVTQLNNQLSNYAVESCRTAI